MSLQVEGFHPAEDRGVWNGAAYRLLATAAFGDVVHQIARSGEGTICTGVHLWRRADESLETTPVTCSMVFQGPWDPSPFEVLAGSLTLRPDGTLTETMQLRCQSPLPIGFADCDVGDRAFLP